MLQDVALTNKILKLVNSSFYKPAGAGSISTISNAVVILGFDTIRNIVVSLLLFDQMQNRDQAKQLMEECVRSILTGVIAKEVGASMKVRNAEEIFVCAMLSNLGRLLATYYFPEEAEIIAKLVAVEEVTPDVAACRVLGISFSDLGIGVAKTWGFPERMMRCMDASSPRLAGKPKSYDETLHSTTLMAQDIAGKVIASHDADPKLVAAGAFDTYKRQLPLDSRAFGAAMGVAMEKFTEYARAVSFPIKKNPTALRIAKTLSGPTQLITQPGFAAGAAGAPATPCAAAPSASLSAQPCISVAGALLPDSPAVDAPAAGELLSAGIQDLSNAIVEERPLSDVLRIMLEAMYRAMGFRNIVLAVRDARQQEIAGRFGLRPGRGTPGQGAALPCGLRRRRIPRRHGAQPRHRHRRYLGRQDRRQAAGVVPQGHRRAHLHAVSPDREKDPVRHGLCRPGAGQPRSAFLKPTSSCCAPCATRH